MTNPFLALTRIVLFGVVLLSNFGPVSATEPERLPKVLLLGASITIAYTPFVRDNLEREAVILRANRDGKPENCQGTTYGIKNIDRWLVNGGGNWDVIYFNFGLHDMKRVDPVTGANSMDPSHPRQAEPEQYERQLREIVEKLKASGAKLVFATTTPFPKGVRPHRDTADVDRYNNIALRIMEENDVAISDLHAFCKPRLKEIQRPVNVHFTEEGSKALAGEVAKSIRAAIDDRQESP